MKSFCRVCRLLFRGLRLRVLLRRLACALLKLRLVAARTVMGQFAGVLAVSLAV